MHTAADSSVDAQAGSALPDASALWLTQAARLLGAPEAAAARFASDGTLHLDAVSLVLQPWRVQPQPQWVAVGHVDRPASVPEAAWLRMLLGANCGTLALAPAALCLDEQGAAVLLMRIPDSHGSDAALLADDLDQMNALAAALQDGTQAIVAALQAPAGQVPAPALPEQREAEAASGPASNPPIGQGAATWHWPLLEQAAAALGAKLMAATAGEVAGALMLGPRPLEWMACSDGHSLLVATAVARPLRDATAQRAALHANFHLMLLSGCSVAHGPDQASLQGRWDSSGLDGTHFARWLTGFAQLAASFDTEPVPPQPDRTSSRN